MSDIEILSQLPQPSLKIAAPRGFALRVQALLG
jgi:hypothetical protein